MDYPISLDCDLIAWPYSDAEMHAADVYAAAGEDFISGRMSKEEESVVFVEAIRTARKRNVWSAEATLREWDSKLKEALRAVLLHDTAIDRFQIPESQWRDMLWSDDVFAAAQHVTCRPFDPVTACLLAWEALYPDEDWREGVAETPNGV